MFNPVPHQRHKFVLWTFRVLATVSVCTIIGIAAYVAVKMHELSRHRDASDAMDLEICRLSMHRPPNLTDDQWAYCLFWTWNLHGHYGGWSASLATPELERMIEELQQRIDRGPNLDSIDWIWDQYVQHSPGASQYDHYRPTAPHNQEALRGGYHGNNPLSQWQENFRQRLDQQGMH